MTPGVSPLAAIEGSGLGQAMRQWLWLYPAVEIVHLTGIAILVGSIAVLDLRLLGLSRALPVRRLAAHVLPWTLASFALILPSGLMLFVAHASDLVGNPVFALKIVLILAAGANAGLFHGVVARDADKWEVDAPPPPAARASAALSLTFWVGVIACGRLLAYT